MLPLRSHATLICHLEQAQENSSDNKVGDQNSLARHKKKGTEGYDIEMAGFLRTRKRSREDDLPCESTPLSKRINNLHLNYDDGNSSSSSNCSIPNLINDNNNYLLLPTITGGGCGSGPAEVVGGVYEYNPELNADQNPYYYEKNKMLYDLHVERVKRSNH
ncbi:uncharacterized protein LOC135428640 [Drosophila montana]|uniref:uncharacterized protein LOC135428640 n=1 Tax=Drosophila montana TaxID=40370 RepID=UPI00313BEDAA